MTQTTLENERTWFIPPEYQISDFEIDAVWGNANFGPRPDRRAIILDTLLKVAGGFHTGSTATSICQDLGLIGRSKTEPRLTKKGSRVMYYWNEKQKRDTRPQVTNKNAI